MNLIIFQASACPSSWFIHSKNWLTIWQRPRKSDWSDKIWAVGNTEYINNSKMTIGLHPTVTNFMFLTFLPLVITDNFSSSAQCTRFSITPSPSPKTSSTSGQDSKPTLCPCVCKLIVHSICSHKLFHEFLCSKYLCNGLPRHHLFAYL